MSEIREQVVDIPGGRIIAKQEVHATITRACPKCGAGNPGGSHPAPWQCQGCDFIRPADEVPGKNRLLWRRIFRTA